MAADRIITKKYKISRKQCPEGTVAAYEGHWKDRHHSAGYRSAGTINSVQNRMLLRNDIHALFDNYAFLINLDFVVYSLHATSVDHRIEGREGLIIRSPWVARRVDPL
jgi:hypothetical protein